MPSVSKIVRRVDRACSELYLKLVTERGALIAFFFHNLFRDETEIARHVADPLEAMTIQRFRRFVEYYAAQGYTFVAPDDLCADLDPHKRYVLITFDDGYANNHLALPVLNEFRAPATFFIATNYIKQGRAYWWDVIYRERVKRGASADAIEREQESLKAKRHSEIEQYVRATFGADAFTPVGDIDRPMTPAELRAFAQEKYVRLGNHTHDHAILPNYDEAGIRDQLARAQRDLAEIAGVTPTSIAYPNGLFTPATIRLARELGLQFGLTVIGRKNYLPLAPASDRAFALARFHLSTKRDVIEQCRLIRSDILLYPRLRDHFKRGY